MTFSELADYRLHMIQVHDAPLAVVSDGENIVRGNLVFWCKICEVHIPRTESTEDNHFASHLLEVNEVMQPFGLVGFEYGHQWLHPSFCPFCLFDKNAPLGVRMSFYQVKSRFMDHVESHLKAMKDGVHCACPAATESGDGIQAICDHTTPMSKDALKGHLVQDHGMIFSFAKPKKQPSQAKKAGAAEKYDDGEEPQHDAEKYDEEEHDEGRMHSPPLKKAKTSKKVTTETPRQPLRGKDANQK